MIKRLLALIFVVSVFMGSLPVNAWESFLDPGDYPNVIGHKSIEFFAAFDLLLNLVDGESPMTMRQQETDSDHALEVLVREDYSDVYVLYRLSDLEILVVACKVDISKDKGLATAYQDSVAMGKTFSAILSTLTYLDGGEKLSGVEATLQEQAYVVRQLTDAQQKIISDAGSESAFEKTSTLNFQGRQVTASAAWDGEKLTEIFILHAAPEYLATNTEPLIYPMNGLSMMDTLFDGYVVQCVRYNSSDEIERFDIVICNYPDRGEEVFIKRVVGIPGDTVEISDGYLYINGAMLDELYINYRPRNDFALHTVPVGEYFVLGDNRASSYDSRSGDVGSLPVANILAKVIQVVYPTVREIK